MIDGVRASVLADVDTKPEERRYERMSCSSAKVRWSSFAMNVLNIEDVDDGEETMPGG